MNLFAWFSRLFDKLAGGDGRCPCEAATCDCDGRPAEIEVTIGPVTAGPAPADCPHAPPVTPSPAHPAKNITPPACPFCGGAGKCDVGIAEKCDCKLGHCEGTRLRGGPHKACAVCSGSRVVPAAVIARAKAGPVWLQPLTEYARAGAWN